MELENLTKMAELGFSLYIEFHRYGDLILAGIDFPLQNLENYTYYGRESVHDYIEIANSPGDLEAMNAYDNLCEFADENEAFLFVHEKTIDECLKELDKRAASWLELDYEKQTCLLNKFISKQNPQGSDS